MSQPTSFRLPPELLARVDAEAAERGMTVTALVTSLLDEGLRMRRFPGIAYRDGPSGRRATLIGGPDVWEVVRAVAETPGLGEARLRRVARETGTPERSVRLAIDFYSEFPEEVDARIARDREEEERLRARIDRRERLLAT